MESLPKKILWISDVTGWAYENRFNRIRKYSKYDHVQILTSGLSHEMVCKMIVDINADLIIVQNPRGQSLIRLSDVPKTITIFSGQRGLLGWSRYEHFEL